MIKKNRIENGSRELLIGLNPHSKGDIFSKFILFLFAIKIDIKVIINLKDKIIIKGIIIINILSSSSVNWNI